MNGDNKSEHESQEELKSNRQNINKINVGDLGDNI